MTRCETWKWQERVFFFFESEFFFFSVCVLASPPETSKKKKEKTFPFTSSKLVLDASCSIGYPRYRRMPLSPSMYEILERQAAVLT